MLFNTATGVISGTPTTAGPITVTITATNISGTGTGTVTINITTTLPSPPAISSGTTTGTVGVAFSYSITATNSPTGYSSSTLPAGLSLNSAGIISGIPTAAGTFTITDTATNAGGTGTGTIIITINPAIPIVTTNTATGIVGTAFTYMISATGTPTSYTATPLPAGLSFNTVTGVISGTPTTAGPTTVTITATNISGTGTGTVMITINPVIPIVTTNTATGTVGVAFTYTISATGTPTGYTATPLPAGLSFNTTTGVISGTPTTAGPTTVTITATNISGTGTGSVTITINPVTIPIPVVTSNTITGIVGVAFTYTISATNTPTIYSATPLPAGLTFNPSTGVISGTPTTAGPTTVTITATNSGGTGTGTVIITITLNPPVITSGALADGTISSAFSYSITATNSPTSFGVTGTLPAGLSINTTTGIISGIPTVSGVATVTITATNAGGTGTGTLTITINSLPGIPIIGGNGAVSGIVGTPFSFAITAPTATSFDAINLPPGLIVDPATGTITGTPTIGGVFTVTISATNVSGTTNNILTITITDPVPVITSDTSTTAEEGIAFTYPVEADNAPTNYSAAGLPAGLTINATTGVISGTPTLTGSFATTITVTNSAGSTTQVLHIKIIGQNPVLAPNPVTQGVFTITLPDWPEGLLVNIEIRNLVGKEIQVSTAVINDGYITVNVPGLIAGNYVAIIMSPDKKIVKKFTIK